MEKFVKFNFQEQRPVFKRLGNSQMKIKQITQQELVGKHGFQCDAKNFSEPIAKSDQITVEELPRESEATMKSLDNIEKTIRLHLGLLKKSQSKP